MRVDFLVIGSGISGLSYALEAAKHGRVAIVTKDVAYEGSTHYAQGGISAVIAEDDTVEAHVEDTQVAGDFLCDPDAVDVVCREGKAAVRRLVAIGTQFTRDKNGDLHLAREGGHSEKRIVHADDMTGKEVERALLESAKAHENVTFYEYHLAKDLVTASTVVCDRDGNEEVSCDEKSRCVGAEVTRRSDGTRMTFLATCTLLAAGGAGQLFPSTTNPSVSTGDGVAMAVRVGAAVANMEFYQFHPTALYTGSGGAAKKSKFENAFLVTEAVRGHGGRLFDSPTGGSRFMEKYDERLELAPRDVVARAIDREIKAAVVAKKDAKCVWLDVTHLDPKSTLKNFPGMANMEFYQFHPTALYTGSGGAAKKSKFENAFLVTEAVRGHGGRLFDSPTGGSRFMEKYDERLELAPRDVVARAIDREIKAAVVAKKDAKCVWLDVTHLDPKSTLKNFPGIAKELLQRGIDITTQRVPVTPAAHYLCGGVATDLSGQTTIEGLFACGENAYTGVHGANRLASNSLLEAAVFANRAVSASVTRLSEFGEQLAPTLDAVQASVEWEEADRVRRGRQFEGPTGPATDADDINSFDSEPNWCSSIRSETQRVMWSAAGIVRETSTLLNAELELEQLLRQCEHEMRNSPNNGGLRAFEVRNLLVTGLCVLRSAVSRKESRGLHYTLDFPDHVETERKPTVVDATDTEKYGRAPVISLVHKMNDDLDEAEIAPRNAGAPAR